MQFMKYIHEYYSYCTKNCSACVWHFHIYAVSMWPEYCPLCVCVCVLNCYAVFFITLMFTHLYQALGYFISLVKVVFPKLFSVSVWLILSESRQKQTHLASRRLFYTTRQYEEVLHQCVHKVFSECIETK